MNEQKIIRIIVIMNNLKNSINPAFENKYYQKWCKDRKGKFRDFAIEETKKEVLKEIRMK